MTKTVLLLSLIVLLLSPQCNKENPAGSSGKTEMVLEDSNEHYHVEFIKENSIRMEGQSLALLHLDREGVNIHDYPNGKTAVMKKYDRNLKYLRTLEFNLGQGPNDLGGGTYFEQVGDKILAPDNKQQRVNIFDQSYTFQEFVGLGVPYVAGTFSRDGNYIAGLSSYGNEDGLSPVLYLSTFPGLDIKMKYITGTYNLLNEQKRVIIGAGPNLRFFFREGKLYLLDSGDYSITQFDMSGQMTKRVRVSFTGRKVPKDKKKPWLIEHLGERRVERLKPDFVEEIPPASTAVPLGKGFVVIRRGDFSTRCRGRVEADYFDYDLNLLGKTSMPCFFRIFTITGFHRAATQEYERGYLYLTRKSEEEDTVFFLEKWRVNE